jgi:hypothetical protein
MTDAVKRVEVGGLLAPEVPAILGDAAVAPEVIRDLVLKTAYVVTNFTTEWAVGRLRLPVHIVAAMLEEMKRDRLVEVLGTSGAFGYRYAITDHGRGRAVRLLEVSGYVGPAPVSVDAYASMLEWQLARLPKLAPHEVGAALSDLVLPPHVTELAGLAASSARSLFIHGPPGNGKTSLGHLIHDAFRGDIWIPHCVAVDSNIIRIFDPQCHEAVPLPFSKEEAAGIDHRWVLIHRPLIVAAGELTMDSLDLSYSRARGYYEAPMHVKANGGTFLLDDFGRQRIEPRQLLNRWVFPLEHGFDYLTLQTGQKVTVPFRQMLIICTNLDPNEVMDPAFLRRMGYRLYLDNPSAQTYGEIFDRYAIKSGAAVPPSTVAWLIERYAAEGRPLRSCEPRDLIERARDFCAFHGRPFQIDEEVLDLAWRGYFGDKDRLGTNRSTN